ncbi:hypothetical protein D3C75_1066920 [compost metagenome]
MRLETWAMLLSDNCTASKKIAPSGVSATARPLRMNSSAPMKPSSSRICLLMAAWVTHSDSAARVKLRYFAAATNAFTARSEGICISA